MDLMYGLCVAATLFPLQCEKPVMKFREIYQQTCSAPWPGRTGEPTDMVQRRVFDGMALYADYVRTWHEACDGRKK